MPSTTQCNVIKNNQNLCNEEKTAWMLNAQNAIGNLIGRPSNRALRLATTEKNKRIEGARHVAHKKLYAKLVNYTMEAAGEANYDEKRMNVEEHVENWGNIFSKRLRGQITPRTMMQGTYKMQSMNNLVDRIIAKRDKVAKSEKGISRTELFIAPPEYIASWVDKFGFIGTLIEKIMALQDNNIRDAGRFLNGITETRSELTALLTSKLNSSRDSFNFDNSLMGGLKSRDANNNEILLLRRSAQGDGEEFYTIYNSQELAKKENDENYTMKESTIAAKLLTDNRDEINDALVKKYVDTLMDELGNGQVRNIVPKLIEEASPDDKKIIDIKIKQLQNAIKNGDRVPGIHTKVIKNMEYRYVMIKQGEGSNIKNPNGEEEYHAYLIDKAQFDITNQQRIVGSNVNFIGKTSVELDGQVTKQQVGYTQTELDSVLTKGFYRSDAINDFGKARRTNEQTGNEESQFDISKIHGGHRKQYINFKKLKSEPNPEVVNLMFNALTKLRIGYKNAFDDISAKNKKEEQKRNDLKKRVIAYRTNPNGKIKETEKEALKWMDNFYEANGIDNNIYTDINGDIRTSTSFAKKKSENYFPNKYTKFTIYQEMLRPAIDELTVKITTEEKKNSIDSLKKSGKWEDSDLKRLYDGRKHLQGIQDAYINDEQYSPTVQEVKLVKNLKHITAWTNPLFRRKDGGIHSEYFNESYDALNRQSIMNELADSAFKIDRIATIPSGTLKFLVNRMKIAFGDPTSRAITITGKDTSYADMAEKLSGLPAALTGGAKFSPKQAEKLTKWITAFPSMMFLGGSSAMQNSGQIVNTMLQVGWSNILEATNAIKKDSTNKWKRVAQNTGALNVLTMFTDIMMPDGEPRAGDLGFLGIGGFQIPMPNMITFTRLLRQGRNKFVETNNDAIDGMLLKMIRNQKGESRESIQELMTIKDLKNRIPTSTLRKKRAEFYDAFTAKEGTDTAIIKKLYKDLLGDQTDALLKRMVSWKLSWWFDEQSAPGKDFFTFTGSEERLRMTTIVAALLHAQKIGLLDGDSNSDESYFMTDHAVKIARSAVYQTQFGMTPPYLGEGFNGFGRALWQYKQYPSLQMMHDYQVWKKFTDGNDGGLHGLTRITEAVFKQFNSVNPWNKQPKYDPSARNVDHDAIAMARFLSTRAIASVLATSIGLIPFLGSLIKFQGMNVYGMMRGAENPAVAIATRALMWTVLFGMGADDEEEEKRNEIVNSLGFLLFPVALGMLFNLSKSAYEAYEEHID